MGGLTEQEREKAAAAMWSEAQKRGLAPVWEPWQTLHEERRERFRAIFAAGYGAVAARVEALADLADEWASAPNERSTISRWAAARKVRRALAAHDGGLAARVEALADEWDAEGKSLIDHCHNARDVAEGSTLHSCADLLRAALAAPVPDSPPAPHTQAWLNTADPAGADKPGRVDSRDEVQGRIDGLDARDEALVRARAQLTYAASPTMGRPGDVDPAEFALNGATEQNVRTALAACIRGARAALDAMPSPDPATRGDSEGGQP